MDALKYRKLYLSENWGVNRFRMIKHNVAKDVGFKNHSRLCQTCRSGINHPLVLSKKAYWINKDELCIGYKLDTNPEIYRPIFSHSRQRKLDRVHDEEMDEDGNKEQNIKNPYKFWNKIKTNYFKSLYKKKFLPVCCIENIIMFTYE